MSKGPNKVLQRKRQKVAKKKAKRQPHRLLAIEARKRALAAEREELFEKLKAEFVAKWDKSHQGQ